MGLSYSKGDLSGSVEGLTLSTMISTDGATFQKTMESINFLTMQQEPIDETYFVMLYLDGTAVVGATILPVVNTDFMGDIVVGYFVSD